MSKQSLLFSNQLCILNLKGTDYDQQILQRSISNGNVLPDHTNNGQLFNNSKTKFMKKTTFLTLLVIMTFGFLLTGCQQDDSEPKIEQEQTSGQYDKRVYELSKDPEVQAELQFMKENLGINLSHVIVGKDLGSGSYFIQSPDSWDSEIITRSIVQDYMSRKTQDGNIQARHRKVPVMATAGSKDIRYLSSVPAEWKTAINSARLEWNGLGKSLTFNTPTNGSSSSGKINVSFEPLTSHGYTLSQSRTIIAAGAYPDPSNPIIGLKLIINTESTGGSSTNSSQKKYIMAHELGHTIGFRHTDSYDGVAITTYNTACSNAPDPSSVLRPGSSPVPSWTSSGFSTCDKDAFDWFY